MQVLTMKDMNWEIRIHKIKKNRLGNQRYILHKLDLNLKLNEKYLLKKYGLKEFRNNVGLKGFYVFESYAPLKHIEKLIKDRSNTK